VDVVIGALASPDPSDDLPALLAAIATLRETDFPSRAQAIARAIERARPEVVGLQEVWTIDIDLRALGLPIDIDLDFLAVLQTALADRRLHYEVAAIVTNVEAAPIPGAVVVVDHDAILVDPRRVAVTASVARNFTHNLGPVAPGVTVVRGFVGITATIRGEGYAFFNTHLEPNLTGLDLATLRAAQAAELLAAVGSAPRALLMGDFNDVPGSLMHRVVGHGGFRDAWAELRPGADGLTCCHVEDLSNRVATFDERIDYMFVRGWGGPGDGLRGDIQRLGEVPADRVAGPEHPLWPSDHAGLVARLFAVPDRSQAAVAR
jgi:endonuclease/exonuclease/phosphatase family metal-dependent hydrolase